MTILITGLRYNNLIVGLRFKTPQGVFDADRIGLRKVGIFNVDVPTVEELIQYGDELVTEEEYHKNLQVEDISESPKLAHLVEHLKGNPKNHYSSLFYIKKPFEQSLQDFILSGWLPERISRQDEHNGQHNLFLPDGTRYRGGWVGKGRTYEIVLKKFHYESCYWQLHGGGYVSEEALKTYKDLKKYNDTIKDIKQKIKGKTEEVFGKEDFVITLSSKENEPLYFICSQYMKLARYEKRTLAYQVDLSQFNLDVTEEMLPRGEFTHKKFLEELLVIAISQIFAEHMGTTFISGHFRS